VFREQVEARKFPRLRKEVQRVRERRESFVKDK